MSELVFRILHHFPADAQRSYREAFPVEERDSEVKIEEYISEEADYGFYCELRRDGEFVAGAIIEVIDFWVVSYLWVPAELRNSGLGTTLVEKLVAEAANEGIRNVIVEVDDPAPEGISEHERSLRNRRIDHFYARLQFIKVTERPHWMPNLSQPDGEALPALILSRSTGESVQGLPDQETVLKWLYLLLRVSYEQEVPSALRFLAMYLGCTAEEVSGIVGQGLLHRLEREALDLIGEEDSEEPSDEDSDEDEPDDWEDDSDEEQYV